MSSLLSSQGMVLVTAMAVSGTVILLLCRQRPLILGQNSGAPPPKIRSCISSRNAHDKSSADKKKTKKRVHFGDDVVVVYPISTVAEADDLSTGDDGPLSDYDHHLDHLDSCVNHASRFPSMPANRMALYSGILQDRLHRMACSY